jgi:hypothetical protein
VTVNNDVGPSGSYNWNENNIKHLTSSNWRASLVPAAAVIPAPIAYIKVVAVKKLVVESWVGRYGLPSGTTVGPSLFSGTLLTLEWIEATECYCEEIRVFKAGNRLNTAAWNNKIGHLAILLVIGQSND